MHGMVGRVAGAVVSVVALAMGVLDLAPVWPWWVWVGLGIVGFIAIAVQLALERRGGGESGSSTAVNQTQTGGTGSTNFQAGRDITYTERSGEGGK